MASINELKEIINLHELATHLGLERPGGDKGNYRSPTHEDKNPSLAIYQRHNKWYWTDHSGDDRAGGSCIDLVIYVEGGDVSSAVKRIHQLFSIPFDNTPRTPQQDRPRETHEKIAYYATKQAHECRDYLVDERGIIPAIVDRAIECGSVGFNTWTSTTTKKGEVGYGGPAAAFIIKSLNPGAVKSVDLRYLDPKLNGGVKTQSFGEKVGHPWFMDLQQLRGADTVYVVESPINALSIACCGMPFTTAIAVRGVKALDGIDWTWFHGKQMVLCFDNDEPDEKTGRCAGQEASWTLYDILAGKNISALMIDQAEWECNDVNDILTSTSTEELKYALKRFQPWALQGLPGNFEDRKGRPRLWLPSHDTGKYWSYRVKPDFTTHVSKVGKDQDTQKEKEEFDDLCGFRIAAISRVTIASATSVLSGGKDAQPRVLFSVSVQTPRHGAVLQRRVFEDEELHNAEKWAKFGPVFKKSAFSRLVNILERSADLGSREAINFVGLGWMNNKLVVNEGHHCYFTDPDQQCPYSNLIFPSGVAAQGATVIEAYNKTFKDSAALISLVWALGAHLKAFMGYWPHLVMQASKGSGKSTLCKKLEGTIGMTMFGRESMSTAFRVLTSVSHTSHPVGWEEISAGRQEVIDNAVSCLQQSYQYSLTRRGAKMTEFLIAAPVLLAGEDVPVKSLEGKVVRTDLSERKGLKLPLDLPVFPVRQWLEFLGTKSRDQVNQLYEKSLAYARKYSAAKDDDPGAIRMTENYAAVLCAWGLLIEFCQLDKTKFNFTRDLVEQMNLHMVDTESEREPWVWIMDIILSEIDSGKYRHPLSWGDCEHDGAVRQVLYIRHRDIMNHIQTNNNLREIWSSLPIKSPKVFKQHLNRAGVVLKEDCDKQIGKRRVGRLLALGCDELEKYGLTPAPEDNDQGHLVP